jgi:Sap, sulfolipid-1-addressing protein
VTLAAAGCVTPPTAEEADVRLQILPLAITMMAGPQILAAVIFVTTDKPIQVSLAFVVGVAVATTLGVVVAMGLAALLGEAVSLGDPDDRGSVGRIIQLALVGLLILAAVKSYIGREKVRAPKWLGALQSADPRKALLTALVMILVLPSDVVVLLTVGVNLRQHGASLVEALPFIAVTTLLAALPLLTYMLFRRRAERAMPKLRDLMNSYSWLVNIVVYLIFIVLIL